MVESVASLTSSSPVWDRAVRRAVQRTKMSTAEVNRRRSNCLLPGNLALLISVAGWLGWVVFSLVFDCLFAECGNWKKLFDGFSLNLGSCSGYGLGKGLVNFESIWNMF